MALTDILRHILCCFRNKQGKEIERLTIPPGARPLNIYGTVAEMTKVKTQLDPAGQGTENSVYQVVTTAPVTDPPEGCRLLGRHINTFVNKDSALGSHWATCVEGYSGMRPLKLLHNENNIQNRLGSKGWRDIQVQIAANFIGGGIAMSATLGQLVGNRISSKEAISIVLDMGRETYAYPYALEEEGFGDRFEFERFDIGDPAAIADRQKTRMRQILQELMCGNFLANRPDSFYICATNGVQPDDITTGNLKIYTWIYSKVERTPIGVRLDYVFWNVPLWAIPEQNRINDMHVPVRFMLYREKFQNEIRFWYTTNDMYHNSKPTLVDFKSANNVNVAATPQKGGCWSKAVFSTSEVEQVGLCQPMDDAYMKAPLPIMLAIIASKTGATFGTELAYNTACLLRTMNQQGNPVELRMGHISVTDTYRNRSSGIARITQLGYVRDRGRNNKPDMWGIKA